MKRMFWVMLLLPMISIAQSGDPAIKGIKWTEGLTWEQVKEKATQENKYIFLDCYTTWCGPCKMMDNQVYHNDSVGDYFNDRFISVKVQMDKTEKDNEHIKSWYITAEDMIKEYKIEGYPSFVFLSPAGVIVHKDIGYKPADSFVATARIATTPGKVYDDGYAEYDQLLADYKKGNRNYGKFPFMINMALKHNDQEMVNQLLRKLTDSVSALPPEKRYTKEIIQLWSQFTLRTDRPVFCFFYEDGKIIDKVMGQKDYATAIVDRSVQAEIVAPFFLEQTKGSGVVMSGMYISGPGLKLDSSEADWDKLEKMIREKFNTKIAQRNVLSAKIEWYLRHQNYPVAVKHALDQLNKYPPDLRSFEQATKVNNLAWNTFLYSTDQKIIHGYIKWMQKVVETHPNIYSRIDTYANLLYKAGRKQEAIQWEEKAVRMAPTDLRIVNVLEKMKAGKPTFLEEGAVWK